MRGFHRLQLERGKSYVLIGVGRVQDAERARTISISSLSALRCCYCRWWTRRHQMQRQQWAVIDLDKVQASKWEKVARGGKPFLSVAVVRAPTFVVMLVAFFVSIYFEARRAGTGLSGQADWPALAWPLQPIESNRLACVNLKSWRARYSGPLARSGAHTRACHSAFAARYSARPASSSWKLARECSANQIEERRRPI